MRQQIFEYLILTINLFASVGHCFGDSCWRSLLVDCFIWPTKVCTYSSLSYSRNSIVIWFFDGIVFCGRNYTNFRLIFHSFCRVRRVIFSSFWFAVPESIFLSKNHLTPQSLYDVQCSKRTAVELKSWFVFGKSIIQLCEHIVALCIKPYLHLIQAVPRFMEIK
jgi:hypothetical protein